MKSPIAAPSAQAVSLYPILSEKAAVFRPAEKILIAYFAYTAVMLSTHRESASHYLIAWSIPFLLVTGIALESRYSAPWSRVTRDWAALGLILLAYREADWFAGKPALAHLQQIWVGGDRVLLNQMGLRAALESLGGFLPSMLEAVYLSLYAIPAICMGALYWYGGRARIDKFLTTLLFGTLCAYALLPYFPTISPRLAFPTQDLPNASSVWRTINVWLLEHCDIRTSVFPSGHVAVAFSSAFGLLRAIPERRWPGLSVLAAATIVYTATIYCRYHYAADGLASIGISLLAWVSTASMDRDA